MFTSVYLEVTAGPVELFTLEPVTRSLHLGHGARPAQDSLVIFNSLVRVTQHLVGFRDELKLFQSFRVINIPVWMVFLGLLVKRLLDLSGGGLRVDPEVIVEALKSCRRRQEMSGSEGLQ